MITKTYSINCNFRQWAKNNSDVEYLILEGTLPWKNFNTQDIGQGFLLWRFCWWSENVRPLYRGASG